MSGNLRRYRAIRNALPPCYAREPQGNLARHVTPLAALISGMVGSGSTPLPKIASNVPDGTKVESRVKRFSRWLAHAHIAEDLSFVPCAEALLRQVALPTLVLVIDGSVVGWGCIALMINVVY